MAYVFAQVITIAAGLHCGIVLLAYLTRWQAILRYALPPLWLTLVGSMTAAVAGAHAYFTIGTASFFAAILVDQLYRNSPVKTLVLASAAGSGLAIYFAIRTLIPIPQGVELATLLGCLWAVSSGYLCYLTIKRGVPNE
tara:strand:- start:146 stop:562 length:417 start_codon:yes stop_codon:yes gene_type:complete